MREGLSTSKLCIGRADRPGDSEHLAIAFKHGECYVLISEPTERGERHRTIGADDDQAAKAMSDAWKPGTLAIHPDPILKERSQCSIHKGG